MTRPIIIAVLGVLSFSVDAGPSLQGGFDHEGDELPDPIKAGTRGIEATYWTGTL